MPEEEDYKPETIYEQFQKWMEDGFNEEQAFQLALESWKSALVTYRTTPRKARR